MCQAPCHTMKSINSSNPYDNQSTVIAVPTLQSEKLRHRKAKYFTQLVSGGSGVQIQEFWFQRLSFPTCNSLQGGTLMLVCKREKHGKCHINVIRVLCFLFRLGVCEASVYLIPSVTCTYPQGNKHDVSQSGL